MLTTQEMLDKAVEGLASQGFQRCWVADVGCMYTGELDGKATHCAWGWVDPDIPDGVEGNVASLHDRGIGLAGRLDDGGLYFARQLQIAHDYSTGPQDMKERLVRLCLAHELRVPKALLGTERGINGEASGDSTVTPGR